MTIDEKFEKLHAEKPQIYETFKNTIWDIMNRGYNKWSADGVFHIIRFTTGVKMGEDYKINNNYISRYARMFVEEYPQYKYFFRFKPLRSKAA